MMRLAAGNIGKKPAASNTKETIIPLCLTDIVDGYRLVMKTDRSHGNKFSLQAGPANASIF